MDLIVIGFEFGTQHGGLLGGVLFALIHFHAFFPTATHLICVFPSLAYDTHIVSLALDVLFFFYDYKKSLTH
jgi:hypothetical protein